MLKRIAVGCAVLEGLSRHRARKKHYRPTAVAIIVNRCGGLLLVKGFSNSKWGPVKGGIDWNERRTPIVALLREIREEIGVRVEKTQVSYIGSVENLGFARLQKQHQYAVGKHFHCYSVTLNNKQMKAIKVDGKELSEACWVRSRQALEQLDMPDSRREIIFEAAQRLKLPWAQKM